jgi:hypothetical protein
VERAGLLEAEVVDLQPRSPRLAIRYMAIRLSQLFRRPCRRRPSVPAVGPFVAGRVDLAEQATSVLEVIRSGEDPPP